MFPAGKQDSIRAIYHLIKDKTAFVDSIIGHLTELSLFQINLFCCNKRQVMMFFAKSILSLSQKVT